MTAPSAPLVPSAIRLFEHNGEREAYGAWTHIPLVLAATPDCFNERAYLAFNPDVRHLVEHGMYESGLAHFCDAGHGQGRRMLFNDYALVREAKRAKLECFRDVFLPGLPQNPRTDALDTVGEQFAEDVPVSAWGYNSDVMEIFNRHVGGVVVDLGAGLRPQYFDGIINIELGNFLTTDVRSFAEKIPLRDDSVDCLVSIAVFEHVQRPWEVAREIERVVKPGGTVYIDTAFMAGRHGYPHHYYNMTVQGLTSLFSKVKVERSGPSMFGHPTYSLFWTAKNMQLGLPDADRAAFDNMTLGEFLACGDPYWVLQAKPWLRNLAAGTTEDLAFNVFMTGMREG